MSGSAESIVPWQWTPRANAPVDPLADLPLWGRAAKLEQARTSRDAVLAQVAGSAAAQPWLARATEAVADMARRRAEFTTDDLWDAGLPSPTEPRALGAVIVAAVRAGTIVQTGRWVPSHRRRCAPIPVWRSLIVGTG